MSDQRYKSARELEANLQGMTLDQVSTMRELKAEAARQVLQLREDIRVAIGRFHRKPERVRIYSGYLELMVHVAGPVLGRDPYKFQGIPVVSDPDIEAVAFIIE